MHKHDTSEDSVSGWGASHLGSLGPDLVNGEVLAILQTSHELIPHLLVLIMDVVDEVLLVPAAQMPKARSVQRAAWQRCLSAASMRLFMGREGWGHRQHHGPPDSSPPPC